MNKQLLTTCAIATLAGSFALAGCDRQRDDSQALGDVSGRAVARAEQNTREAGKEVAKGLDNAKQATVEAAQDAKMAGKTAGEKISDKVSDAVITTSVNAELARDANLSALRIDVDTSAGRVALHGSAPSAAARDHATQLASAVKGVVSVDNQLTVDPKKGS